MKIITTIDIKDIDAHPCSISTGTTKIDVSKRISILNLKSHTLFNEDCKILIRQLYIDKVKFVLMVLNQLPSNEILQKIYKLKYPFAYTISNFSQFNNSLYRKIMTISENEHIDKLFNLSYDMKFYDRFNYHIPLINDGDLKNPGYFIERLSFIRVIFSRKYKIFFSRLLIKSTSKLKKIKIKN